VLHHTPDTEATIREAHRILKTGGIAKVMLYHRDSWCYWVELMLRQGVVKGELFRGLSAADIMSKYVEFNNSGARHSVRLASPTAFFRCSAK
jgi:SAM-dependent methyltransferase